MRGGKGSFFRFAVIVVLLVVVALVVLAVLAGSVAFFLESGPGFAVVGIQR